MTDFDTELIIAGSLFLFSLLISSFLIPNWAKKSGFSKKEYFRRVLEFRVVVLAAAVPWLYLFSYAGSFAIVKWIVMIAIEYPLIVLYVYKRHPRAKVTPNESGS